MKSILSTNFVLPYFSELWGIFAVYEIIYTVLLLLCLNPNFFSVTITCYLESEVNNSILNNQMESQGLCPEVFFHKKENNEFQPEKHQVHKG